MHPDNFDKDVLSNLPPEVSDELNFAQEIASGLRKRTEKTVAIIPDEVPASNT